MSAKISLSVEQVAGILKQLSLGELQKLDLLLEQEQTEEIIRRHAEMKAGKKIPLEKARSFKDID